jgi:hypothetical protein
MSRFRVFAAAFCALLSSGCAFSTGFRDGQAADLPPDAPVVVALTEAQLSPDFDAHGVFWSRSSAVLRSLRDHPGLVGYAVRFEIWEGRVRTMTVWRDDASLAAFVAGRVHARAAVEGLPALADARFARVRTTRAEAPLAWPDVETRLARDGRGYYE